VTVPDTPRPSHVVVEPVRPVVDAGAFAAKATAGERVDVVADVFAAGHDVVNAALRYRRVTKAFGRTPWHEVAMAGNANDRFVGHFVPDTLGRWEFDIEGWIDHTETWRRGTVKKHAANVDISLDLQRGIQLVGQLAERAESGGLLDEREHLRQLCKELEEGDVGRLADEEWTAIFWRVGPRDPAAHLERPLPLDVDPARGRFSSWYEFFPRSAVAPKTGPQTLRDAIGRLDHIAAMGFDVVYIPPVHPIGTTKRKGPNNVMSTDPVDVGSPWAIGSPEGGHQAVASSLGSIDDVVVLSQECRARGMELALDIAFQCSPDHPWVVQHPTWFAHRPDGTVQFAENPPKRYEDIYPLDFESVDWRELWEALVNVFRFWIGHGIRVFRVDNPHTKALPFWEWALQVLRTEHPDTIFLAEAFTRPRIMERLAKIGFNQSYTYFAWRQAAWELREYFEDLSERTVDFFRPNVWPNTPDILTEQLQHGGRAAFVTRAVLAATLSPSWGVYGPAFELQEHVAVRDGSEEYLDSEKYQLRVWDLHREDSLAPLLARLNGIRRAQPALQHLRTLWFHQTDDEGLVCYSKTDPAGVGPPVLVVVNIDPHARKSGFVDIDLAQLDLPYGSEFEVVDLLGGGTYRWQGNRNYVDLAPWSAAAHIFEIRPVEQ